jgi:nucleoid DNA-binding protein
MNKSELVRAVYESKSTKLSMIEIDAVISEMLSIMSDKLKAGEEVQLADFGTFALKSSSVKTISEFLPKKKFSKQK